MEKQKKYFRMAGKSMPLLALLIVLWFGLSDSLRAQVTHQTFSINDDTHYYDHKIPSGYKYLYVEAKGGDGGKARDAPKSGGAGARAAAWLAIGNEPGEIPPNSTLRLIPGQSGGSRDKFGGGGGGSAIAFKGPNATDKWQLLLVAGGGGGASYYYTGQPGAVYTYGSEGVEGGSGGTDGNGGRVLAQGAYAGGGAKTDGFAPGLSATQTNCSGKAGLLNDTPVGGEGGSGQCNEDHGDIHGGFGFGGGGSGKMYGSKPTIHCGGGGGGYSGGGGGWDSGSGGGGGSYVNPDWGMLRWIEGFGTTSSPVDGYADFSLTNTSPIRSVHLAVDQTKCLDLQQAVTANGGNIQLYDCTTKRPAQPWVVAGSSLRLVRLNSKCLDLDHSNTANGTNIQLWDCNGTNAQKWIYDVYNQSIRSTVDPKRCLDLQSGNTANRTNIQLFQCNDTDDQKWIVDGLPSAMPSGKDLQIRLVMALDKCVDIQAAGTTNGTNIQLYHCHTYNNSQFFTFNGRQIRMQSAPEKCLDLDNSNASNGANIQLWDCNGTDAQNWIYDGFAKAFRSAVNPRMCIDVDHSNTDDKTNIQLWDCNGTLAQQFVIY